MHDLDLATFLEAATHMSECAYWDCDGPGADDACTCALTLCRTLLVRDRSYVLLVAATVALADVDDVSRSRDAGPAIREWRRAVEATERRIPALSQWSVPMSAARRSGLDTKLRPGYPGSGDKT